MAGQTGAAAYQQLQPPGNEISQGLQHWGDIAAQEGAEARARNERQDIARKKAAQDYQERVTPKGDEFLNTFTGFADADDNYRQFAQKAIEKNAEYSRMAIEAQKRGDMTAARDYEGKMSKLRNTFKNVTNGQKAYLEQFNDFKKAVDAGKVSGLDEEDYLQLADNVNSNKYMLDFDDGDNPIYKTIVTDADGNKTVRTITNGALVNGGLSWRDKVNIVGKDGFVDNTLKQLGKRVWDERNGYYITTKQEWDVKAEEAANARIDVILASDDSASDVLFQITGKRTPRGEKISDEDAKLVRDRLMSAIKGGYDESVTTKSDTNVAELKERQRHNRAMEEDKDGKDNPYSARHYDIMRAVDNNDFSQFGGDFTWEGKKYSTNGTPYLHPNGTDIVIPVTSTNKDGKTSTTTIRVPKNETTVNNLFDAFSGKVLDFDKVIKSTPYQYRDEAMQSVGTVEDLISDFFNDEGEFNDNDNEFVKLLKKEFPTAKIEKITSAWNIKQNLRNPVKINGKIVYLDNGNYKKAVKDIEDALGVKSNAPVKGGNTPTSNNDPLGLGL